jgi:enoyl-CoA hydratase/carnithine racemase
MDYNTLLFTRKGGIGYLTLNRPDKLNALSQELMTELRHALDAIEDDPDVKVVILTGAGRAFR